MPGGFRGRQGRRMMEFVWEAFANVEELAGFSMAASASRANLPIGQPAQTSYRPREEDALRSQNGQPVLSTMRPSYSCPRH